ncbi:nucleotidyltransferase [Clostridium tyrobutyricum]|uniref:nucleotidyltransferase n=1 Tax=Clostridium tyrobutyricum TaxID=1519 RepID=UPI001C3890E0|nr:nucleotidyltransferase [Clostridium tyrobutyricum]MBV4414907.1 nucleotidyltransferase [Clostridium tyrobutyricum]
MKITGIIAEYNPFHCGHAYHIQNTRKITNCQAIIAIISGNFVQRGLPSIIDKWNKTEIALLNGVDLVLELPTLYSVSSAEFFSFGAVSLMENLGVVDTICFGSECDDISLLNSISEILYDEPPELKNYLKAELLKGNSYAEARSNSIIKFLKDRYKNISSLEFKSILSSSNNILALEYLKSLKKLNSNINALSIKRKGENYNSNKLQNNFSSASAIRTFLKHNRDLSHIRETVPPETYDILCRLCRQNYNFDMENLMVPYLKYRYFLQKKSILNIPEVSEGIENRIFRALESNSDYNEIIKCAKTKRYAYTRISRILCQFFLGFDEFETDIMRRQKCPYTRVLGFNETGMRILKSIKKNSSIPVYTKFPKKLDDFLSIDLNSTKAYSLLNTFVKFNSDYKKSPIIFKGNTF